MQLTEAVVVKKIVVGEADGLFLLYTKNHGLVKAYAQGIRKEGAKLKGHLELLSHTLVRFVSGRGGERITYADTITMWPDMRGNFWKLSVAHYVVGLIAIHAGSSEQDSALWEFLLGWLTRLEAVSGDVFDRTDFLTRIERDFLSISGYGKSASIADVLGDTLARPFGTRYSGDRYEKD